MGHLEFGKLAKIRGLITYSISPYEQRALAGIIKKGVPNTLRRIRESLFVIGIPFALSYVTIHEAIQINKKHNRKDPRLYECDV